MCLGKSDGGTLSWDCKRPRLIALPHTDVCSVCFLTRTGQAYKRLAPKTFNKCFVMITHTFSRYSKVTLSSCIIISSCRIPHCSI